MGLGPKTEQLPTNRHFTRTLPVAFCLHGEFLRDGMPGLCQWLSRQWKQHVRGWQLVHVFARFSFAFASMTHRGPKRLRGEVSLFHTELHVSIRDNNMLSNRLIETSLHAASPLSGRALALDFWVSKPRTDCAFAMGPMVAPKLAHDCFCSSASVILRSVLMLLCWMVCEIVYSC